MAARVLAAALVLLAGCATASRQPLATTPMPSHRLVAHPQTGAELPVVVWPDRPGVEEEVAEAMTAVGAEMTCEPGTPGVENYDIGTRVQHLGDEVFSVWIHGVADCGGAHPFVVRRSQTFDLRTGRAVAFDDLFQDYGDDRVAIARAVYPAPPEAPAECRTSPGLYEAESLAEGGFDYTMTTRGLVVSPAGFPHAAEACAVEVVVPYARVAAFAAPDGILARMAAAYGGPAGP